MRTTEKMENAFAEICGSDTDPKTCTELDVRNAAEMWRQQGETVAARDIELAIRYTEEAKAEQTIHIDLPVEQGTGAMFLATYETRLPFPSRYGSRHFKFSALSETEWEAIDQCKMAWEIHVAEYSKISTDCAHQAEQWRMRQDDIYVIKMSIDMPYRDGKLLTGAETFLGGEI